MTKKNGRSAKGKPAEDADQGAGSDGTPAFAYTCFVRGQTGN